MSRSEALSVLSVLGAQTENTEQRQEVDYYATDPAAVKLLLEREKFNSEIWECACGGGHLSTALIEAGYHVYSTDLYDHGFGISGVDFLNTKTVFDGDIITNPPYRQAKEFVEHAIDCIVPGNRVAMFLKLQFLEGVERQKLFQKHPPEMIYISTRRINCCKNGDFSPERRKGHSSAVSYAWFIWRKGFNGEPRLRWFN